MGEEYQREQVFVVPAESWKDFVKTHTKNNEVVQDFQGTFDFEDLGQKFALMPGELGHLAGFDTSEQRTFIPAMGVQ